MPIWLLTLVLRTGIPSRFARAAAWLVAVMFFAAVAAALVFGVRTAWRAHNTKVADTAVQLDRADLTIEASNRVIAADRAASTNQQDRDEDFRNSQDDAREAVNEAQRNRTSPLDAAFDKLRRK